jgi:quercetin dioxygenase-like cupin family protein
MMKHARGIGAAAVGFLLALSAWAPTAKAAADVVWPASALKWEDGPVKGSHVAKLWGDWMAGGPYGVLIKFDAGLMHPMHKHTQSLKIVVIAGTFVHHPQGGAEVRLGPGSYVLQTGGENHVSGCAPGAECEFFMTSGDKFDFITVEAPVKK